MTLQSYYAQLEAAAARCGVDLLAACLEAGVSDSTFYRWRKGSNEPNRETAERVMRQIDEMGRAVNAHAA